MEENQDYTVNLGTDDPQEFLQALTLVNDRIILEYIALNIFQLRQQTAAFLPKMEQLANGPMMGMLGSLFK